MMIYRISPSWIITSAGTNSCINYTPLSFPCFRMKFANSFLFCFSYLINHTERACNWTQVKLLITTDTLEPRKETLDRLRGFRSWNTVSIWCENKLKDSCNCEPYIFRNMVCFSLSTTRLCSHDTRSKIKFKTLS